MSLPPEKSAHSRLPWAILAFDGLLGVVFLTGAMETFASLHSPVQEENSGQANVRIAAGILDGSIALLLIAAGMCLLAQWRWAGMCQRAAFWALLVRSAFVGMELWLPSPGGVGGLGLIGMFLMLAVLTSFAWAAALSLRNNG